MKDSLQASTVRDPKPFRTALVVSVLLLLGLVAFAGTRSYQDLLAARAREQALAAEIEAGERRIESLERRLERLAEDPAAIELLAREELWMARPDDVVIVLPATDGADVPQ